MSGKFALIIGNTEYADPGLAQLTAPGKDAEDFARVLKDTEIGAFDQVNIVLNQSSSASIEAIDEFFDQRMPDDLLVLYFSGHGVRDELGSLYLAVRNTIRSRLRSTAIKSDYIREAMDQSRSRRQVLILDCCNSGAFAQGTKAATGVSIGTSSAFEGGYGRVILTASDSTQFAWEGDRVIGETDNSLFTHYLVEGLEGEADLDGDGRITVDEVYDYAYEKVRLATPKQTPSKFSSKQQGEIVLRQSMRIENIKPVDLPSDLVDEIEDTRPYVREEAVRKLEKIIKGRNIGLARSAREALGKIATDDDSRRVSQAALQVLESFRIVEEKAEAERKAMDEADRLAALKAEEERLMREKEAAERRAKEEAEKLQRAKAQREAAEQEAERLKAQRKAAELAAREASEKASIEKAKKEAAEREAMELASSEKAEEEVVRKESKVFNISSVTPATLGIIVIAVILCGFAALNYLPGIFASATATEAPVMEVVATESPATEAPPTETPTLVPTPLGGGNGQIAFTSNRDEPNPETCGPCNSEIYVMNADGTEQTRLTNNAANDFRPAWSPDGTRIAFQSTRDDNYEIYVMNADGTEQTRLTNNTANDYRPAWSPDGTRIAFVSDRDGNEEIYVMNADGTEQTRLTNNIVADARPAWSPDGQRIVFDSNSDNVFEIYVMNADGSEQTRLTNNASTNYNSAWSTDGTRIAFVSDRDGNEEIYVMNADGSEQTRLTNNASGNYNPAWSPDGTRIAFESERNESNPETCGPCNSEIYVMNADGSGQTRLTNSAASDYDPVWQPTVK